MIEPSQLLPSAVARAFDALGRAGAAHTATMALREVGPIMSLSTGIALYPQDALQRQDLMSNADNALSRAKLEGRHIGRTALVLDRPAILRDRESGQSLSQLAKGHHISRATIYRVLHPALEKSA